MNDKQTIETIGIDRQPIRGDLDRVITDIDPCQYLPIILTLFTLLSALKRLFRLLKKLFKQKNGLKLDLKLLLQLVGTVATICKAIERLLDDNDDSPSDL
jgi:hypothetical protein